MCWISETARVIFYGQLVSLLLCISAICTEVLQQEGVRLPTSQTFLNYILLGLVFLPQVSIHGHGIRYVLAENGWTYLLLAVIDVEANFLIVKAYQYTSITSVQLLDCFTIPCVMALSYRLLGSRYGALHYVGALVCLAGLVLIVIADSETTRGEDGAGGQQRSALGDGLVLAAAILYAVSNVGQEYFVKHRSITEYLGMLGFWGSIVSGLQSVVLELGKLLKATW